MPNLTPLNDEQMHEKPPPPPPLTKEQWYARSFRADFCAEFYTLTYDTRAEGVAVANILWRLGTYPFGRAKNDSDSPNAFLCKRCGKWHLCEEWYLVDPVPYEHVTDTKWRP